VGKSSLSRPARTRAIALAALTLACTHDFGVFSANGDSPDGGEVDSGNVTDAGSGPIESGDMDTAGDDVGSPVPDAGGSDSNPTDGSSRDTGSNDSGGTCMGAMCGGVCVADCAACAAGHYACNGTCVPNCGACNGGTDFVVCLVCSDGGPPAQVCGPADPNGFCLDGKYAHCACTRDTDCGASNNNQRCTNNVCAACGEPQFGRMRCQSMGQCCRNPGPMFGTCGC
jgi:hypothetical protein